MASPFPGIDPYIESQGSWPDFHIRFMNYLCESIADRLPENYYAHMEERLTLVELTADDFQSMRPDLTIVQRVPSQPASQESGAALALEPVTVPVAILDEIREVYIEIRRLRERTLVAAVELLSPGNKSEPGRGEYLAKRNALLRQPVHLVELDFLVGGRRLPMRRPLPPGDFYALVARGDRRPDCDVYAWTIHQPSPTIRLPLLAPDPEITVNLADVLANAYNKGRYDRSIDYSAPLTVPLAPEDRAWAEERARAAQR
jgi:hypothetical protein